MRIFHGYVSLPEDRYNLKQTKSKALFPSPRKLWMSGSSWDQRMRPVRIFGIRKRPRHGRDAGNNLGGWINERNLGCEGSDLEWQKRQIEAILYVFDGPLSRLLWALLFTFLSICLPKISNPFLPDTLNVIVSIRLFLFHRCIFYFFFLAAKIPIWWAIWASKRWISNGKHGYRR